jgi:transcriptional regulator with XRE-family HTH domain
MSLKKLGEFIRKSREAKNLTTRQFASLIDKTPGAVSQLENGLFNPSDKLLYNVSKHLNLNEDVLFALNGKATKRLQEVIARRPEMMSQLLTDIDKAPDHAVLKVIRTVSDGKW